MELNNALGKVVKFVPILLIVMLGLIFRCELFHQTIGNEIFARFPSVSCKVDEKNYQDLLSDINRTNAEKQTSCFIVVYQNTSRLSKTVKIYTDSEEVKNKLKTLDISTGTYKSLFSGSLVINIEPISKCSYKEFSKTMRLCILGDSSLSYLKEYDLSHAEISQSDEKDMIAIVWVLIGIFVVITNGVYIVSRKKEVLIREIYGESILKITIQSCLIDFLALEGIYIIAKLFVSAFMSGDYHSVFAFCIYQVGCLLAVALNVFYLKADVRAVIQNVNASHKTLVLLYMLKYAAFSLLLFSLTTNITRIEKLELVQENSVIENISDGLLVSLPDQKDGPSVQENKELWSDLWKKSYDKINPYIDLNIGDDKLPVILINKNAGDLIPDAMVNKSDEKVSISVPKSMNLGKDELKGIIGLVFDKDDVKFAINEYTSKIKVPYMTTTENTPISIANDPIIIYCTDDNLINEDILFGDNNVIYATTKHEFKSAIKSADEKHDFLFDRFTNVNSFLKYKQNIARGLLYFLTSFCTLILLVDAFILAEINKMEYRYYGMDYAIKKIMGYSVIQKNRRQLLLNNLIDVCIGVVMLVVGLNTGAFTMKAFGTAFLALLVMENIFIIMQVYRIEKTKVKKILKGGCL